MPVLSQQNHSVCNGKQTHAPRGSREFALMSKSLTIPEEWTAEEFARQGHALMLAMHRQSLIIRRKSIGILAQLAHHIISMRNHGHAPSQPCASGLPELDDALGGGFASAAVHELVAAGILDLEVFK